MSHRGALLPLDACIKSCCVQWTRPKLRDPQLMLACDREPRGGFKTSPMDSKPLPASSLSSVLEGLSQAASQHVLLLSGLLFCGSYFSAHTYNIWSRKLTQQGPLGHKSWSMPA